MFSAFLIISCLLVVIKTCESNCASCRNLSAMDYYCLACSPGNELVSIYNICIQDTTIDNCAYYLETLDCKFCQPTYAKSSNGCNKMYDGCLLYQNKGCYLCIQGSFISNETGSCVVKYLNCLNVSADGICVQCSPQYSLQNGKCFYNNTNCTTLNQDTGLCSECSSKNSLIGYSCVPNNPINATDNCYLVNKGKNITCKYCKIGFGLYFGTCLPFRDLIAKAQIQDVKCSKAQYINDNQFQCLNLSANLSVSLANCQVVDFGFKRCIICSPSYTLNQKNQCFPVLQNLCLKFDSKNACTECKSKLYLKNGNCFPFPNFCVAYSSVCTECESSFQLINGRCVDPNCQLVNNITGVCQICSINYQLNVQNLCKYIDANCKKTGSLGDCTECQKGYMLKPNGLCAFQDMNCLSFNNRTNQCLCTPGYYYNKQAQLCIPLSNNCLRADVSGICTTCASNYTLTSDYQCVFLTKQIPNCKLVNQGDFSKCGTCNDGFFTDKNGVCQVLPFFCNQFDPITNTCTLCKENGVMRNGVCVDKNCQFFDTEGSCLACLQSYVFGNFGQCILQAKDPYCKVYQYNICKMCTERYYFNFQFNCIPVSAFCNTFDSNSGICTSCYQGYTLSLNGDCNIAMYNSIRYSPDVLSDSCKQTNKQGQCIECYSNYNPIPITVVINQVPVQVLNCVQKITGNTNCLQPDKNGGCAQCVARMYPDQNGNCQSIDPNCDKYNSTNGACISCYYGFNISYDSVSKKTACAIINSKDPYCQLKSNTSGCLKCYQGYFYSTANLICQPVDPQCATFNQTNGNCLSCYSGYSLNATKCVVNLNTTTVQSSDSTSSKSTLNSSVINKLNTTINDTFNTSLGGNYAIKETNCLTVDFATNLCISCQWGYALINGTCFQQDPHCKTFQNANSLKCIECYDGYQTFQTNRTQCVLQNLIVDHCLKYDLSLNCVLCENGYVLSTGSTTFVCNVIDQNCLVYNSTLNMCQKCILGAVLEGRVCVLALYGIDPNCGLYQGGICVKCKGNWTLDGFLCSQK